VQIPDPAIPLAVGTFVQVTATMPSEGPVMAIPQTALLVCSERHFVYTVNGEHLVRTAVKVGASDAEFVEITDGLYAGDEVVWQPVLSLWMTELAAVKGGQACCLELPKGK
jgi:multidrug efflux pump subunit AcrA (membrane-fusion protein)